MATEDVELPSGVILYGVPVGLSDEEIRKGAIDQGLAKPEDFVKKAEPLGAGARFAYGASEPITGLAQLAYNALPETFQEAGTAVDRWLYDVTGGVVGKEQPFNEAVAQQEAWYQQRAPKGMDIARLAGNIGTGILATRGMGAPQSAAGATLQGGAVGAGFGAATPVYQGDYWNEKAGQVKTGGAAGAALGPVGYGVSRALTPKVRPEVETLRRAGVQPTIGPTVGRAAGRAEDIAQSTPFFGDAIRAARAGVRDDFNKAVLNQVVAPVGRSVDDIGTDGIAQVQKISNEAYKAAEDMLKGFRLDSRAVRELAGITRMAQNLDNVEKARWDKFWMNEFMPKFKTGGVTTKSYKQLDSRLGQLAQANAGKEIGGAFKELDAILKRQAERVNPAYREALDKADEVFTKRVIVEKAANSASGTGGVFTPKQLLSAAKTTDQTKRHGKAAGGKRPFQKLAQAGSEIIGDNYPDSGTAGRIFMAGGIGGGMVADPITTGLLAGGLYGLGRGMYSPAGQYAMRQLMGPGRQGLADLTAKAPLMSPAFIE